MERLQFSWALFMLILGLIMAIAAYLSFWTPRRPHSHFQEEQQEAGRNPVPPILWLVYGATALGMVGYLVWAWLAKPSY
jgi:predicted MFS family arabinose efflux permease